MTEKMFFLARWRAAFLVSLFCVCNGLFFSCSDDESESSPPEEETKLLVTFVVQSDQPWLFQGFKGFVFASDKEGNVLATAEVHAADSVELFVDARKQVESFTLTEIYIKDGTFFNATSYTDLPRGIRWLAHRPFGGYTREPSPHGTVTVNLNKDELYRVNIVSSGAGTEQNSDGTIVLPLASLPGLLYARTYYPDQRFALYEGVMPGQAITISAGQLNRPMATEAVEVPDGIYPGNPYAPGVGLYGYTNKSDYRWPYDLGSALFNDGTPMLVYPDVSAFVAFSSNTMFYKDGTGYLNYNKAAKYDFTMLDPEFVASKTGSRVTFSCSDKEIDRVTLIWHYGQSGSLWKVTTAPGANRQIALPALPKEVLSILEDEVSTDLFRAFEVFFDAYENTVGYGDWCKQTLESKTGEEKFLQYNRSRRQIDMRVP